MLLLLLPLLARGQDYVSECPEENGFFADALQCDRYYECSDGEVGGREHLITSLSPGVRALLP